jgi:hypothetical protein
VFDFTKLFPEGAGHLEGSIGMSPYAEPECLVDPGPLFTGKLLEACRGHGCVVFEEYFLIALQFLKAFLADG